MDNFDITKYIDMAIKRKWWIIIPFLVTLLGGMTYILITPKIYETQTLILVQQQRVPEEYVRSVVSTTIDDRLRTITQQVTSRTNLENIIKEFGLYSSPDSRMLLDDKVALLRQMIDIDVSVQRSGSETSAFTISFRGQDPKKVMEVTNALASNFITENLKIREEQALGTSAFLTDELKSVENQLKEKEEDLKKYREQYMGGLPEQLQTNLSILERLQAQLEQDNSNLRDAENRRAAIVREIALAGETLITMDSSSGGQTRDVTDLASLKNELANLQSRYTENHPDVIRLKETIARLEKEREQTVQQTEVSLDEEIQEISTVDQTLRHQLQEVKLEIDSLKAEIEETRAQIDWYQTKVEETPKREQELVELNRDYDNLRELYNSLLNRKLEAEISVSMEKKQKGEQFRIIDPAKEPGRPVEPDTRKIALMTLFLGLGLGCGLAYLMEFMDTSYKTPDEAEKDLKLPILVSIPILRTERELKAIKRKNILAFSCVGLGFVFSAMGIVIAIKGLDTTMNYIKNFL